MRTYNVSLEQCLIHVVKARPCVLPNDGFLKQLILYDRFLVDRRRQREVAAQVAATKEIPIHRKTCVPPLQTAPIILAPPQCTAIEPTNPPSLSSVDSSSLEKTPSLQSSTSADSIHVIPIQIVPKPVHIEKVNI